MPSVHPAAPGARRAAQWSRRRAGPRTGPALVALAGPASNLLLAALFAIPVRLLPFVFQTTTRGIFFSTGPERVLFELLIGIVTYNLILGIFNLLPIFPLDGFSILLGILPAELAYQFEQTRQWGFFLLLAFLFLTGYVPLLGEILYGPVGVLQHLFTGL